MLEKALAQSNGKWLDQMARPADGIPRTTLDARIRQLSIKTHTAR